MGELLVLGFLGGLVTPCTKRVNTLGLARDLIWGCVKGAAGTDNTQ